MFVATTGSMTLAIDSERIECGSLWDTRGCDPRLETACMSQRRLAGRYGGPHGAVSVWGQRTLVI